MMGIRRYIVSALALVGCAVGTAEVNKMEIVGKDGKVTTIALRGVEEIRFGYDPLLEASKAKYERIEDTLYIDVEGERIEMVRIEAGTYSRPENDAKITISEEYYIAKTEVTQSLVEALMLRNPSKYEGGRLPVHGITYEYADSVVTALNTSAEFAEYEFALPTEAQWIVAATGAQKSEGYKYAGGNTLSAVAWNSANSNKEPHEVGTLKANETGLYDMSGNVFEICEDWYAELPEGDLTDYVNTKESKYRVIRGGGYTNNYLYCQLLKRGGKPADYAETIGMRLALVRKK